MARYNPYRRVDQGYRRQHTTLIIVSEVLLLVAFILLLLVAISLPIVKPVFLLSLNAATTEGLIPTEIATEVRFGVWGYCATSVLNAPTLLENDGLCTTPALGYSVDSSILQLTGQAQLVQAVLEGLVIVLVLHPIVASLCFLTLLSSLFARWHGCAVLSLVLVIITAILTSVLCAVDIAIVAVAKSKIGDISEFSFEVGWGNAPWMSLVATILLWAVVLVLSAMVCGCCGVSDDMWISPDEKGATTRTD